MKQIGLPGRNFLIQVVRRVFYISIVLFLFQISPLFGAGSVDLAVIKAGPSNAYNATDFTYTIILSNNGPDSAHGATFTDVLFSGAQNVNVTCTGTGGGASCPIFTTISNATVQGNIPTFPNGSSVTLQVTGRFPLIAPTSVRNEVTISVPTGMSELNSATNIAITNTQITMLPADLAVTNFTQSYTGSISTTSVTNTGTYSTDIFVDTPTPLIFSTTYTNNGSGAADGGTVSMSLYNAGGYSYMTYSGFTVTCTATGGAVCPGNPANGSMLSTSGSGKLYLSSAITLFSNVAIPTWPAGGSVTFTVTFTPVVFTYPYSACGNGTQNPAIGSYYLSALVPSGTTDPISGNNSYLYGSISTIASTPIGNITFGTISQLKCISTDLSTTLTDTTDVLVIGDSYTTTFTYTNNGTGAVYDSTILGEKRTYAYFDGQYKFIDYKDYTIICTASGGAICPTPSSTGSYGGDIRLGTGTFTHYQSYPYLYTVFSTQVPEIPPGGSVKMAVTYTPTLIRVASPPLTCGSTTPYLTYSTFTSTISNSFTTDTNSANNTLTRTSNRMQCIDLYVTNTLSNANPPPNSSFTISLQVGNAGASGGSGVSVTNIIPAGFIYDSAQCTGIGGAICGTFQFDPVTRLFSSTIPYIPKDGSITFTLSGSAINYSSSWKSDTLAQLGENYADDASGPYAILVSSGIYINQMGSGIFERIPTTNVARLSFTVEGIDPTVSKIISTHSARPGDVLEYTLYVRNPGSGALLSDSSIYDPLPAGFTYLSTNSITLSGAIQTSQLGSGPNDPLISATASGQRLTWGNYTLLPNGSIIISFQVAVNPIITCQAESRDNSAYYDYTLPTLLVGESFYDGTLIGHDQDDLVITCTPILARSDSGVSIEINSGASLAPTSISLLSNDTLSGVQANENTVMISLLTGAISSGNTLTGVTLSSSGILTWPESSASGVYHVDYQICEVANIYNCSTAQAHVAIARLPRPIQANADSGTFLNTHTGTLSLLDNDTFSGSQAHTGVIHISLTGASALSGVSLDSEGDLIIPPSSLTGVFLLSYEICEITSPTNCSSTEITLTLEAPIPATIIQAYADSGTFFVGNTAMLDVLYNDTLSGSVILTGAVVLAFTGENMITGSTLDTNGILTIPATTLTGVYILSYEICESINLTNCSTAEITITIASFFPALIYANADSGTFLNTHTGTLSLLDNDTFSGSQAHTGVVTFGFTGDTLLSNPLPDSYINPDGLFITPPTSLTGTFTLFYEICEIASPINCSATEITVILQEETILPLTPKPIQANADSGTFLNTHTGTLSLLDNDTFSGSQAHTGVVTFGFTGDTLLSNPLPDSYINPDGLFITPPTSLTGTFTLFYEICEIASPINCSTAQIAITIESTPIIFALLEAHDDVARFLNTMTGTIDILQNDLFSGSHATLTDTFVSLTGSLGLPDAFIDGGIFTIPASLYPAGEYTFSYVLCEVLHASHCDTAHILITLEEPLSSLIANPDAGTFSEGNAGILNILQNDTYSGGQILISAITLSLLSNSLPDSTLDEDTGLLTISENTPTGEYTLEYQICEITTPSHCSTTSVVITITTSSIGGNTGTVNTGTVTPPPTSGGSTGGHGGPPPEEVISEYIPPLLTQNPQKTVKENAEETESTPEMIPSSCRAQVLNLNDARLKAYATELAIMNRNNFSHRLTRAEFLSIAFRSANIQLPPETIATTSTGESSYSGASLETESVFYRSITYAIALGIISGNAEDFRPNDPISRGEATKILVNTFHFSPVSPDNIFADVPRGNTLAPYIESAHENCIIHGKNTLNGELIKGNYYLLFAPKDTITLGETLKILYNMTH